MIYKASRTLPLTYSSLKKFCNKRAWLLELRRLKHFSAAIDSSDISPTNQLLIKQNTQISNDGLTPELSFHLITPTSPLWYKTPEECPFPDPYWAFYWPGGQALARYILDVPSIVRGRRVLDIGSGCGAAAIAAAKAGASQVTACDTDKVAAAAISLNSALNHVNVDILYKDLIGDDCDQWDCILLGDMLYDAELAERLSVWTCQLVSRNKSVIVGDPGRWALRTYRSLNGSGLAFTCVAKYQLPVRAKRDNIEFSQGLVWLIKSPLLIP